MPMLLPLTGRQGLELAVAQTRRLRRRMASSSEVAPLSCSRFPTIASKWVILYGRVGRTGRAKHRRMYRIQVVGICGLA